MALAVGLMHEMALRRQDAMILTFADFINSKTANDGSRLIRFKCVKQNVYREVAVT